MSDMPDVNVHELTVGCDIARLSPHRRHFWKFGQRRIHVIPRLSAGCEDVQGRLIQARVIETPGCDHREVRNSAGFSEQTRTALRAKTAAQRITTVCFSVVILNRPVIFNAAAGSPMSGS